MEQENTGGMATTFSTLNVNAQEFVPTFCTSTDRTDEDVDKTPETNGTSIT